MTKTIALLAVAGLAGVSNAQLLVSDTFSYPDGSLTDAAAWTTHSGTAGDLLVSGGMAVVQHGTPSEDANIAVAPTAGTLFYGIDFKVSATGRITGGDFEYFAHFKDGGFNFTGRLDVVEALGGGDFSVGIASDDSVADATWATDLSFDTFYRAIVGYNQDTNQAQLWIDATDISDLSILGDDQADPGDAVTQFALRQSDSSLNETVMVDNLRVGTTFESVVPAPASAALLGLGGLAAARRRRA